MPLLRQEMAGTHPKVWWLVAGGLINHIVRSWPHVISSALHLSTSVWKLGTLQSLILRGSWRQEAAVLAAVLQ